MIALLVFTGILALALIISFLKIIALEEKVKSLEKDKNSEKISLYD